MPKSRDLPMRLGKHYGEIEYTVCRGVKVIQRWHGSSGNICLSHLLMSFLFTLLTADVVTQHLVSYRAELATNHVLNLFSRDQSCYITSSCYNSFLYKLNMQAVCL